MPLQRRRLTSADSEELISAPMGRARWSSTDTMMFQCVRRLQRCQLTAKIASIGRAAIRNLATKYRRQKERRRLRQDHQQARFCGLGPADIPTSYATSSLSIEFAYQPLFCASKCGPRSNIGNRPRSFASW